MTKRRTHSSIDRLPEDLRNSLTRMVVDNVYPDDYLGEQDGFPKYADLVDYVVQNGYSISRSAVGRWAMGLRVFEKMKTAGLIAREVMSGLSDENATQTQKAAAEMITAHIIEFASQEDMSAKEIRSVATAIKDCTAVSMKADEYQRGRIKAKAEAAADAIDMIVAKKKMDPETLKLIREQVYGIFE